MKKIIAILAAAATLTATLAMASCSQKKTALKILDTEYVEEDYAICVAKENDEFLGDINDALAELKSEGIADKIVAKYISGTENDIAPDRHAALIGRFIALRCLYIEA